MIKEVTMYVVVCDSCGKECKMDSIVAWTERDHAVDLAVDSDWHVTEDKQHCPDCYRFDDNDEIVFAK